MLAADLAAADERLHAMVRAEVAKSAPAGPDWTRIATDLRRPFTIHAVQFRILEGKEVKSRHDHKANVAAYITARTAVDRLNHVCPGLWSDSFVPVEGGLRCDLTVGGLTRSDVGWSAGTKNAMQLKALYSDAFKRAAVKFGVAVSLYSLPGMVLWAKEGHIRTWERPGAGPNGQSKTQYFMQEAGEKELRRRYELWLTDFGVANFGEPLDHGHVEGAVDLEEGDVAADEPEAVAPVVVPLEVLAIQERAKKLGHAALSDLESLQMMTVGRSANIVKGQIKEWSEELDAMEAKGND
jgi:hypothetical protein